MKVFPKHEVGLQVTKKVAPEVGVTVVAIIMVKNQWFWSCVSGNGFHKLIKNTFDLEFTLIKSGLYFPLKIDMAKIYRVLG